MNVHHFDRLQRALRETAEQNNFQPLLDGFRALLESSGIYADRIQLPMTKLLGFRHPTYWGVIVTWYRELGFDRSEYINHSRGTRLSSSAEIKTPYRLLLERKIWYLQEDLQDR